MRSFEATNVALSHQDDSPTECMSIYSRSSCGPTRHGSAAGRQAVESGGAPALGAHPRRARALASGQARGQPALRAALHSRAALVQSFEQVRGAARSARARMRGGGVCSGKMPSLHASCVRTPSGQPRRRAARARKRERISVLVEGVRSDPSRQEILASLPKC